MLRLFTVFFDVTVAEEFIKCCYLSSAIRIDFHSRSYDVPLPNLWIIQNWSQRFVYFQSLTSFLFVCYQYSEQEQDPSLKWWNRTRSLTMISVLKTFEISLVTSWQSPQTRRFLNTRIGVWGGKLIRPKAMASLSLCSLREYSLLPSLVESTNGAWEGSGK